VGIRQHAVLVLLRTCRLLVWLDPSVHALDKERIAQPRDVHVAHPRAGAQEIDGRPELLRNPHLVGKAIASASGQDAHRSPGTQQGIGDLVLGSVAAITQAVELMDNVCFLRQGAV
jgi:hypothetical protein